MARTTDKPKEGMGARVERERKKLGWSQEKLAEVLQTSRSSIKSKELGERPFSLEEANILCDLFHMTLDELVNGVRTENVSIHEDLGLTDEAITTLRYFNEREYSRLPGLCMALSSPDVLAALSRYMTYTPDEKGYYLSESAAYKHDRFIECRMSQEFFADVLKQNVLHMLDNAKVGDYDSVRHFFCYEAFTFADEEEAKLAESSDNEEPGKETDNG